MQKKPSELLYSMLAMRSLIIYIYVYTYIENIYTHLKHLPTKI